MAGAWFCAPRIARLCLASLLADSAPVVQVRKLAAEVYGAHEQNGNWNDEGEWHVVGDEDLESSDDDLLGSDVESSSDDNEELNFFGAPDAAGDDSSGDDYDSMDDEDDDGQGADWLARLSHISPKPGHAPLMPAVECNACSSSEMPATHSGLLQWLKSST